MKNPELIAEIRNLISDVPSAEENPEAVVEYAYDDLVEKVKALLDLGIEES